MRIILYLLFGFSVFWHNLSAAEEWRQDTRMLPQYCKDRAKGINSAEFSRWRGSLGSVYEHAHHYCSGVYAEQKAKSSVDQGERKRWLRDVASEMAYVAKHCSSRCVFYPELQTRWGWALAEVGQHAEAIGHFELAIQAKPKYPPAYAKLSDLYVDIKQPGEARRVLSEGLKAAPGARMLERRLRELEKS